MLEKNIENTVEGLELIVENTVELNKEDFFNILSSEPEGIILKIERVGNTFKSKWKNNKGEYPLMAFIDYTFTYENNDYEVGISYNLGDPIEEDKFLLKSGSNLFKILEVVADISKVKKVKVTKTYLDETLTGIRFKAKVGAGFNGFIIKPVELIED